MQYFPVKPILISIFFAINFYLLTYPYKTVIKIEQDQPWYGTPGIGLAAKSVVMVLL